MQRVERHIITKYHFNFKQIDHLCFLSKNLYNYVNYLLRQNYFENMKKEKKDKVWINEYELVKKLTAENQVDFRALPNNVSQQIIYQLFKNWKSFWKLTKCKNLNGKPDIYLNKYDTVVFINGCFWHRHKGCKRASTPKSNHGYWIDKFEKNKARDKLIKSKLKKLGFNVVIVWECQVNNLKLLNKIILEIKSYNKV